MPAGHVPRVLARHLRYSGVLRDVPYETIEFTRSDGSVITTEDVARAIGRRFGVMRSGFECHRRGPVGSGSMGAG